jgi:hypothetical protein
MGTVAEEFLLNFLPSNLVQITTGIFREYRALWRSLVLITEEYVQLK